MRKLNPTQMHQRRNLTVLPVQETPIITTTIIITTITMKTNTIMMFLMKSQRTVKQTKTTRTMAMKPPMVGPDPAPFHLTPC